LVETCPRSHRTGPWSLLRCSERARGTRRRSRSSGGAAGRCNWSPTTATASTRISWSTRSGCWCTATSSGSCSAPGAQGSAKPAIQLRPPRGRPTGVRPARSERWSERRPNRRTRRGRRPLDPALGHRRTDDDGGYRAAPHNHLVEQRPQVIRRRQGYLHHVAVRAAGPPLPARGGRLGAARQAPERGVPAGGGHRVDPHVRHARADPRLAPLGGRAHDGPFGARLGVGAGLGPGVLSGPPTRSGTGAWRAYRSRGPACS
jgi:hypothetical protein